MPDRAGSGYSARMHVVIFEGSRWSAFAPLSLSRPVFSLSSGTGTLLARQLRKLKPDRLTLWVRAEMEAFCRERVVPSIAVPCAVNARLDDEPALLVNARTVDLEQFEEPTQVGVATEVDGVLRLARVRSPGLGPADALDRTRRWLDLFNLPRSAARSRLTDSLWDLIYCNPDAIRWDFAPSPAVHPGPAVHLINESQIAVGEGVHCAPGVVLDASKGPIVVDAGASLGAHSVLVGPCFVGAHSRVKPMTQVREGTSVGPVCTVGGEVSQSIILGHSNKGHEGFLGHSYLGEWVNLGSGTTTSNLKNTYGEIRARVGTDEVATGRQFLGSVIGDHGKTAILTRLMAGTYIGYGSMIAAAKSPRFVPSYTFLTDGGAEPYRIDKAIEVARRVMARRDRQLNAVDEALMHYAAAAALQIEK